MRDTFRSRQRKIMCFSELQTGRLIWLPECDVSLPFPELRRWLCSAQGEDIWRTEEGGRTDGSGGVTVQGGKGLCQLTLLQAGSLKAAAPAARPAAIQESRLDPGSAGG